MCDQNLNTDINMTSVSEGNIKMLLDYFSRTTYHAKEGDAQATEIVEKSIALIKKDYSCFLLNNTNGELTANYPCMIPVIEFEKSHNSTTICESSFDPAKLREMVLKSRSARCRARFPLPVIQYKGKNICRSATLSGGPEMYSRSGYQYLFGTDVTTRESGTSDICDNEPSEESPSTNKNTQSDWQLFDKIRNHDIQLLKMLNVGSIMDLMVENKKVKFGLNITSSEKVDKENRYGDFHIVSLPYPGCEFFKQFRDNNYNAIGLYFDWSQSYVDAPISVPEDSLIGQLKIDWDSYRNWDLVEMTRNYTKFLVRYFQESTTGALIHCISGWDRTPLFISLLRLSLWADGLIHQSLDEPQILYLTVAYDWFLFGHNLVDRLDKGEDIFFFCFYMLKYLTNDEYSMVPGSSRHKLAAKHGPSSDKSVNRTDSDTQLEVLLENDLRGSKSSLSSTCSSVSNKSQDTLPFIHADESNGNTVTIDGHSASTSGLNNPLAWSPQARRTSPVTVPVTRLRQRQESSSSLSVGSWQMITGTGSLRTCESNNVTVTDHPASSVGYNTISKCDKSLASIIDELTEEDQLEEMIRKKQKMSPVEDDSLLIEESYCFVKRTGSVNGSSTNSTSSPISRCRSEENGSSDSNNLVDEDFPEPLPTNRKERLLKVRELFYSTYFGTVSRNFRMGPDPNAIGTIFGILERVGLGTQRT